MESRRIDRTAAGIVGESTEAKKDRIIQRLVDGAEALDGLREQYETLGVENRKLARFGRLALLVVALQTVIVLYLDWRFVPFVYLFAIGAALFVMGEPKKGKAAK